MGFRTTGLSIFEPRCVMLRASLLRFTTLSKKVSCLVVLMNLILAIYLSRKGP